MEKLPRLEDDPDYQELLRLLREQTPEQLDRLKDYLDEKIKEEKKDEG